MAKPGSVDEYVRGLDGWQAGVMSAIRALIGDAAPNARESIKWAQPVYEESGPFCYVKAFKNHVNLGFWREVDLGDPEGVLEGTGDRMQHVKIT